MAEKAVMIVNPAAGTRKKENLVPLVSRVLAQKNIALETFETTGIGHASQLASEALARDVSMVIVAGGDGTVNEVASALWNSDVPMAILPCGSGNGLARSLGVPQDFEKAARIISDGVRVSIDRGEVDGTPFYCTSGLGFDAEVSYLFEREPRRGRLTYIKTAINEYYNYKPKKYTLLINGLSLRFEALLVAVCNCPQYGNNAYIAPAARLDDGLLDVTIVHSGSLAREMLAGIELFSGRINKNFLVDTFKVREAKIILDEIQPLHTDGEPRLAQGELNFVCSKGHLEVLAADDLEAMRINPLKSIWNDMLADIKILRPF